jgi:hypothetical protein
MMAIRDPIVVLFAVMSICMFLGQSFANFFPTYVCDSPSLNAFVLYQAFRLTQTLGYDTTDTLLLAAYVFRVLSSIKTDHVYPVGLHGS